MVVVWTPGFSATVLRWIWQHCASRSSIKDAQASGQESGYLVLW